jgi:thymidine kinase
MWVLVDECQFLTEEQVDQLSDVVDLMGVNVLCYGLRTDFRSKLFPASKRLFEIADEFQELKSSCKCNKKASINARFDKDENIITEGEQVLVGGDDIYQPMCRKCWKQKIREKQRVKKYETSN